MRKTATAVKNPLYIYRGHLTTQETEVKFQTESVDISALSIHDLPNKVDESDNRSHEQQ